MFRALLCPSSGARDYDVDYQIGRLVLGLLYVRGWVRLGFEKRNSHRISEGKLKWAIGYHFEE